MSVMVGSQTKYTYEDYALLPNDGRIHEIIDGDHYMSPAPGTYHQTVSRRIQFQLYQQIEQSGKGVVFNAPTDVELTLTDIVQPDLLVIGRARQSRVSPSRVMGAPDLAIEILSAGHEEYDRGLKLAAYQRAGVLEYWIVDPNKRLVQKYRRKGDTLEPAGEFGERVEYRREDIAAMVDLTQVW